MAVVGMYTLSEQLQAMGSAKWPTNSAGSDQYFNNVTLLLHGDGTNASQNNTFIDSSANNFSITRNGNTTQGSFSPYGSEWSNYFDGTGDYLTWAPSSSTAFGTGDFTIELWYYLNSIPGFFYFLDLRNSGQTTNGALAYDNTLQNIIWWTGSTNKTTTSGIPALNVWTHIAVSRASGTLRIYINGQQVHSSADSTNYSVSPTISYIGCRYSIAEYINGYISNVRIVKGTALYTSTFTPSTTPLTAITNTSLLTCNSNRFKDDSTNAFAITKNGDVKVSNFAPHKPTTAYATGTNGGSAYFDGTGDYLSFASNAAFALPAAFTWEAWFYPLRQMSTTDETMLTVVNATTGLQISHQAAANSWGIAENGIAWRLTTTTYPQLYAWNHIVVVRSGTGTNQTSIFLNGVRVANGTVTTSFAQGQLTIGANSSGLEPVLGNMSDVRLVKGTAVYDPTLTTLTIPTSPLTAVTNTQLLCSFKNATIIDNSCKNVLETVGNAQISTTQKKYGTGALYFDGTGDYLYGKSGEHLDFGTGNFTIECWFYISGNSSLNNSSQRIAVLFSCYPASGTINGGYVIYILGDSSTTGTGLAFEYFVSGTPYTLTYTGTISQTTWHHIAVSKSGTITKIYFNGIEVASATLSNQNVNSGGYPVNVGRLGYAGYLDEFNGYIDELRITKGIARYTANFTPPSVPFGDL